MAAPVRLPGEVVRYVNRLLERIGAVADRDAGGIAGAHLVGSLALGGYRPGLSDVDLVVVTEAALPPIARSALADRAAEVPCPTRGLELVVYHRDAVADPRLDAAYDLNLNAGPGMASHRSVDPSEDPAFWFVIDRDIGRARGRVVSGAMPARLLAEVPRADVLDAVATSLAWAVEHEPSGASTVLNALRARHFAETGEWTSKESAAVWALTRTEAPDVVRAALALRTADPDVRPHAASGVGLDVRASARVVAEAAAVVARARCG
jgi:hypothetical protein